MGGRQVFLARFKLVARPTEVAEGPAELTALPQDGRVPSDKLAPSLQDLLSAF